MGPGVARGVVECLRLFFGIFEILAIFEIFEIFGGFGDLGIFGEFGEDSVFGRDFLLEG